MEKEKCSKHRTHSTNPATCSAIIVRHHKHHHHFSLHVPLAQKPPKPGGGANDQSRLRATQETHRHHQVPQQKSIALPSNQEARESEQKCCLPWRQAPPQMERGKLRRGRKRLQQRGERERGKLSGCDQGHKRADHRTKCNIPPCTYGALSFPSTELTLFPNVVVLVYILHLASPSFLLSQWAFPLAPARHNWRVYPTIWNPFLRSKTFSCLVDCLGGKVATRFRQQKPFHIALNRPL